MPPIGIGKYAPECVALGNIGIGTISTFSHFTLAVQSANPSSSGSGMRSITLHCVRGERICKICVLAENSEAPSWQSCGAAAHKKNEKASQDFHESHSLARCSERAHLRAPSACANAQTRARRLFPTATPTGRIRSHVSYNAPVPLSLKSLCPCALREGALDPFSRVFAHLSGRWVTCHLQARRRRVPRG